MADIAFGFINLIGDIANKADRDKQAGYQLDAQARQATSDAATARTNAGIIDMQKKALIRQQTEVMGDITEKGASVSAERFALAAAEGFGGGGTARSVQTGISRRVKRDLKRVRDSLNEQTGIFDLQRKQQLDQATAFDDQATFATTESNRVDPDSFTWFRPSSWF